MSGRTLTALSLALLLLSCGLDTEPTFPGADDPRACNDGIDNDDDGRVDFPADPGCEYALDATEEDPLAPRACSDGVDNDGDGRTDFDRNNNGVMDPEDDPGCDSAADDDEMNLELPECGDMVDNDSDGLTDMQDPNCQNRNDDSETPECRDGKDNDNDGLTDHPADLECDSAEDDSEG